MASISFGNMPINMRRADSDFGIADVASAQSFLYGFSPIAVNPIAQASNFIMLQGYDQFSNYVNVGLTGTGFNTSTYHLSKMTLEIGGSGYQVSIAGDITMSNTGSVSGVIGQVVMRNLDSGVTYASISGLNQYFSLSDMFDVFSFDNLLTGNDSILGGSSADYLSGEAGADSVSGGGGADSIYGGDGNDLLSGGSGNDLLYGSNGNDRLYGSLGNDVLSGGAGSDLISGGAGKDRLAGGSGNDIFKYLSASESGVSSSLRDVITDFTRGQDRIDLSAIDANVATSSNNAFTRLIAANASFTAAGQLKFSGGVLYGNIDSDSAAEFSIALTGISSLSLANFIL